MRVFLAVIFLVGCGAVVELVAANRVFYAGGAGKERFNDVHYLSDGTALIAGQAENLAWLPINTPRVTLAASSLFRLLNSFSNAPHHKPN